MATLAEEPPKSFGELRAEAAAKWAEVSRLRAERLQKISDEIAMAPDVVNAPQIGSTWSHQDIQCPKCAGTAFVVNRYGCVNGVKDKCELKCSACEHTDTWSWPLGRFLGR